MPTVSVNHRFIEFLCLVILILFEVSLVWRQISLKDAFLKNEEIINFVKTCIYVSIVV